MASKSDTPTIKIPSKHVIFISDIHFGVNTSSEEWQENIENYFKNWFFPYLKTQLKTYPDAVVICLGDVYHDRKSIDIDVNNLCIDIFEEMASMLPCYIINGNHDLSKKTNLGNSSLRSLSNISNLTVIKEPTLLTFVEGRKNICKMIAIPYLGDCNIENKELVKYSKDVSYALMHTDITNMKFDNGMTIVGAVDADKFKGKMIISGHIHKRQESAAVLYVGSPYHLSRSDIGDTKGIYLLVLETGEFIFTENNYSPIFQRMDISKFMNFTEKERIEELKNTYTDIYVDESEIDKYKISDVYDMLNNSEAKRTKICVVKKKNEISSENSEIVEELSLDKLVEQAIEQLQDVDEETKNVLKSKSNEYYKNALMQLQD